MMLETRRRLVSQNQTPRPGRRRARSAMQRTRHAAQAQMFRNAKELNNEALQRL